MKKRFLDNNLNDNKTKNAKLNEIGINDLPKVLIIYLSEYFDLNSLIFFSSTNKKYNLIFSEFRKGVQILVEHGFQTDLKFNRKNEIKSFLEKKDFSKLNRNVNDLPILYSAVSSPKVNIETVRYLVEYKCDMNMRYLFSDTPFFAALKNKNINSEIIKYLVENKADMNGKFRNETVMHILCFNENITKEIFEFFFEKKIIICEELSYHDYPLYLSCKKHSLEIIKLMIEKTRQFEKFPLIEKNSFVLEVLKNKNVTIETITFLVEKKCNLQDKEFLRYYPIHLMCKNENISLDIIEYLIENKASVKQKNQVDEIALHLACQNEKTSLEIIECLSNPNSVINSQNKFDDIPLHYALSNQNIRIDILRYLIENKSNLNSKNISQLTPLEVALKNDKPRVEIVKYLVENKSEINRNDENNSPLHISCFNRNFSFDILKYLIENKSDMNHKNNGGETPLHLSCMNKKVNKELLSLLIENKSDVNAKNYYGETPLHKACVNTEITIDLLKFLVKQKCLVVVYNTKHKTPSRYLERNLTVHNLIRSIIGDEQSIENYLINLEKEDD